MRSDLHAGWRFGNIIITYGAVVLKPVFPFFLFWSLFPFLSPPQSNTWYLRVQYIVYKAWSGGHEWNMLEKGNLLEALTVIRLVLLH